MTPSLNKISKIYKVSLHFIKKVEIDMFENGCVLHLSICNKQPQPRKIKELEAFILHMLYLDELSQLMQSYAYWLEYFIDTEVAQATISKFFNHFFKIKDSFCKPNFVPYDKFKPNNIQKALK